MLEINDEVVSDRNRGYCMLLINGSLQKNGKLDVYIKRDYSKGKNWLVSQGEYFTVIGYSSTQLYAFKTKFANNFESGSWWFKLDKCH